MHFARQLLVVCLGVLIGNIVGCSGDESFKPRKMRVKADKPAESATPTPPPNAPPKTSVPPSPTAPMPLPESPLPVTAPAQVSVPAKVASWKDILAISGDFVNVKGVSRHVNTLTEQEWQEVFRHQAVKAWEDTHPDDTPLPPDFVAKYITRKMAEYRARHPAVTLPDVPATGSGPASPPATVVATANNQANPAVNVTSANSGNSIANGQPPAAVPTSGSPANVGLAGIIADGTDTRLPVPNDEAAAEATKLVKKIFWDEYTAANSPEKKRAFCRKLYNEAIRSGVASTEAYVLLKVSKDVALAVGDFETAFNATDKMVEMFQMDRAAITYEVMEKTATNLQTPQDCAAFLDRAVAMKTSALEKDDYLSAKRILTLASKVATRMNRTDILRQIAAEQDDLSDKRKASVEVAEHALRLLQAPDDPNANLAFGKYLCFNKDDWQKGLVLLTRGNDSTLKVIAADELASQDSPTKQAEVANRWWELADSNPQYKNAIRWHAADLYTAAIERLDGLGRSLAEKRIGEMKNVPRKTANAAPRSLFPTGPES